MFYLRSTILKTVGAKVDGERSVMFRTDFQIHLVVSNFSV